MSIRKKLIVGVVMIAGLWALGAGVSIVASRMYSASDDSPDTAQNAPDGTQTGAVRSGGAAGDSHLHIDRTGRVRLGKASFYAEQFEGHPMADGTPMRLYSNNAASLTLPLGTTAKVTNLQTGQSAVVTIRDRGPYVKGRIVDLSPVTASKIGIDHKTGVAKVSVKPIEIPMPDGTVRVASLR